MMRELRVEAKTSELNKVQEFAAQMLKELKADENTCFQVKLSLEEVFVNIASYAYPEGNGTATISVSERTNPHAIEITFRDSGIPYNPLAKEDPDVTLAAEDRQIGGLGIYMVKKSMDDVLYEYKDGCNNLTLIKNI